MPPPDEPEASWLEPAEQRTWRALLLTTQLLDEALDRQLRAEAGMPHAYYQVLVVLSEAGRRLRMGELAEALRWSRSRLSHAVARMEADGWLARRPCPVDGRGLEVGLTDEGEAVLRAAAPGHVRAVRQHVFDRLTRDQVGELGALCDTLLAGLVPPA